MRPTDPGEPPMPDACLIAAQNDAFRRFACLGVPPARPIQGRLHVTRSLMEAGDGFMAEAVRATGDFDTFAPENDPAGWHDFGAVTIRGKTVFWKIDLHEETTFSRPFLSVQRWFGSSNMLTPVASTCMSVGNERRGPSAVVTSDSNGILILPLRICYII